MEFKASDLIDSVVEEAKRNGITIAQQLMSNRMLYLTSKEAIPISEQTDDEFLMCALESNDISPITLLRELRNRTLNFGSSDISSDAAIMKRIKA